MTVRTFTIRELCVSPYNVRQDQRAIGALDALKRSILKHGLLMPLVVHPMLGNKKLHGAIAGGRRYRALKELIAEEKLRADFPIEAVVREGMTEAELIDISTAENLVRRDLYPYETYAAIARSRRRGSTLEDIAETLGQDVDWVRKGARLGQLAEPVFDAYSAEKLSLECAKAFAATEDEKLQLQAFHAFQQLAPHARTAGAVRAFLKVGDRELTRLLRFVGLERYRAAGGVFEMDLFAEEDEFRGLARDEGLLRELAAAKREELVARIRARIGRDIRFAAEPPTNDFSQADRSLQIHPPESPLAPADEARLAELHEDEARLLDRVRALIDDEGKPLPGNEPAIAELDREDSAIEAAIAAIEDKRPVILPEGDIAATLDIDDAGEPLVRYWWSSRKAQADALKPASSQARKAAPAPSPRKASSSAADAQDDKPIAEGAAIVRSNINDWTVRDRADRRLKAAFGLTADGVQTMRTIRRSLLRAQLIEDMQQGSNVARDYLIFGQLRMLLTSDRREAIGMRPFLHFDIVDLREEKTGTELLEEVTAGAFEGTLETLSAMPCFTEPDLLAAFQAYRALDEDDKGDAAAMLACLVLERSLDADGYRVSLHDVIAEETGVAGAAQLRDFGAFTPTAPFFNLLSKDHRLELAIPFVGRDTVASWAKRSTADQNDKVARVFLGTSADMLEGMDADAASWVHPLLTFETSAAAPSPADVDRALETAR